MNIEIADPLAFKKLARVARVEAESRKTEFWENQRRQESTQERNEMEIHTQRIALEHFTDDWLHIQPNGYSSKHKT